ncbi:hypothetical protein Tco_0010114 [Tanacetum coccineum]
MDWGEVNPTHAYYNDSRTSKDNEDPSCSTRFKTRRTQKTSSALEALLKTLYALLLYLLGILYVIPYEYDDVDDPTEKDLALNVDHIFEADQCDAFDSDVDEAPNIQTMFMVNLSSEDPIYDEAGPSYDSNTPFEVQDHDTCVDHLDEYHEVHEMQNDVQHNYVVDSDAEYASDSNIILYNQYMEDNEEHVVQSNVSSVRNDALMSIIDDMHEQGVQSMSANKQVKVVNDTLTSELARYKELVGVYEKRTKFELTEREQKIDEQMRIIISDRNRKETSLKSELHTVQMQLRSTVDHNKSMKEEVTTLKKDFKQKEDKYIEEFLDIKKLKEKKLSLDAHQEKGEGEGADADLERAIKLSLDPSFLPQRQAPVGGVAIRERVAEEIQRLPDVEGKGNVIVTEEQAAHSLIDLSKKKSTTDQFILQRRDKAPHDLTTGPSSQPQDDTSEKVVPESSSTTDLERTKRVGISISTEDQAGSDPRKEHVTLAGPNPEHMDDDFYATAYPDVHENLKLRTDEHATLETQPSSTEPLSSMKNLEDTDTFRDQFLNDKPTEDEPPINTEATTITTAILEITPFIALQLRVAKLEQDMSEVKKTDHSAALERQTADLIQKYSVQTALENPANYRLYHALIEALIEDENAMDKEVADKVKDHKRKRDSDDDVDDDDEGPSAGSNQDSEQSTKNKLDSNASAAQQPPAHTSSAWQITDTRDTPPGPSMQRSDHQSEQSSDDNRITDEGHVSDPDDTDNAHIPKVPAATWFKLIPEEERPATPEPEWTIPLNDYPEPENN